MTFARRTPLLVALQDGRALVKIRESMDDWFIAWLYSSSDLRESNQRRWNFSRRRRKGSDHNYPSQLLLERSRTWDIEHNEYF